MEPSALVEGLRTFVPADDFARSRDFYLTLGFREAWSSEKLVLFELGRFSFFLQHYFVKEWAENMMMDLRVADVDAWWAHLESLSLTTRFSTIVRIGAPQDDLASGIRRGHFVDPSGVLWHFSQSLKLPT